MRRILAFAVVVGLFTPVLTLAQQNAVEQNVETFMRAKLLHSQKVLEGLTTNNFGLIAKNSQEMSLLSLASTWQVIETAEYSRRSNEFRRAVDDLTKAGKDKNLDGATLAYVNVTLKCVECHKYVRSVGHASLDRPKFHQAKGGKISIASSPHPLIQQPDR